MNYAAESVQPYSRSCSHQQRTFDAKTGAALARIVSSLPKEWGLSMTTGPSARLRARISGGLYVLCIACGFFAEMVVRSKLIVSSDPAATANNILGSQSLYRLGFFADMAAMVLGVLSSIILYTLLKVVSRSIALTVLVLDITSNTVSLCAGAFLFAPLIILQGDNYLSGFSPVQMQSLSLLSLKMYESGYSLNLGIFSGSCFLSGYLIFRSTFLPKSLGILMGIAGVCYLTNSFVNFMPKGFGDELFPWILLPVLIGEGALALWLLIVGLDSTKWDAIAARRIDT
jgi:Domain of unknown function (DUF4386)